MRYYKINVLNPDGSPYQYNGAPLSWSSLGATGKPDLGALQVEIDAPVSTLANPQGAAMVKVWGIPLALQKLNLNGLGLQLYGGFSPGLPLATAAAPKAGLLLQGSIQQAFGNWIGVNQWLQFVVTSDGGAAGKPQQITLNWLQGQPLGPALTQALKAALPGYTVTVNVSSKLIAPSDQVGTYASLRTLAQYLKDFTTDLLGGTYGGVELVVAANAVTVIDGSSPTAPKEIAFTDLIGQPCWVDPGTIQVATTMRADLSPGDFLRLPPSQVSVAPSDPLVGIADRSVLQGTLLVKNIRHVGNFRQTDALAWVTALDCSPAA